MSISDILSALRAKEGGFFMQFIQILEQVYIEILGGWYTYKPIKSC